MTEVGEAAAAVLAARRVWLAATDRAVQALRDRSAGAEQALVDQIRAEDDYVAAVKALGASMLRPAEEARR